MKFVLLITIVLMLLVVRGSYNVMFNNQPCQLNHNNNAYDQFVKKHIIQDNTVPSTEGDWAEYLKKMNITCRYRPNQTFFKRSDENSVIIICNGQGHPLKNGAEGNFCMSNVMMQVYHLRVRTNCSVVRVTRRNIRVIVACDKVDNQCRPVHYEGNYGQQADMTAERCQP